MSVKVPGVARELAGDLTVEADPLEGLSAVDRKARYDATMSLYAMQKSLVTVRSAAHGLAAQSDSIKSDLTLKNVAGAAKSADSLSARLTAMQNEVNRVLTAVGGVMRTIEAFPSAPTADQRQQLEWATEDANKVVGEINRATQTVIPALYAKYATFAWPRKVAALAPLPKK